MKGLLHLIACLILIFVVAACELVNPAFTISCTQAVLTADSATTTVDNSGTGMQIIFIRAFDGLNNLILNTNIHVAAGTTVGVINAPLAFTTPPLANPIRAEVFSPAGGALPVDTVWFSETGACAGLPYVTPPSPPPLPNARDINFDDQEVAHVSAPDALADSINIRILYENGSPTNWFGGDLYNSGSIGVEGIFDLGVQQAIDIFSPSGLTYFNGGAVFCLKGSGYLIWLAASQAPRHPEIIGSYTVPEWEGYTCATLFEPGTLVLVSQNPVR